MKRSTALRHLVELADAASERLRFRSTELGWPLEELWVTGTLLDPIDELDQGSVVLMIDLPPDELPWLPRAPDGDRATDPPSQSRAVAISDRRRTRSTCRIADGYRGERQVSF